MGTAVIIVNWKFPKQEKVEKDEANTQQTKQSCSTEHGLESTPLHNKVSEKRVRTIC